MRAKLDRTFCGGKGNCVPHAPHLFSRDEWGYTTLVGTGQIAPEDEAGVRAAIADCPFRAIGELSQP